MKVCVVVSPKRIFLALVALLAIGVMLALLVAYSGIYSIAASRGHPAWLDWFLTVGMHRSVEVNSADINVPKFDDDELAPLGAAHFHSGCAVCHGAPGMPINPVFDHMLPSPPNLSEHAGLWNKRQLFWIVRHGLQYAGMPGWSGEQRDDEVWPVVAFLNKLPMIDEKEYQSLSRGNNTSEPLAMDGEIQPITELVANCNRCHGTPSQPSTVRLIPKLGGQKPEYLARALVEYKNNTRESGYMEPAANLLSDEDIQSLAKYYSNMREASAELRNFSQKQIDSGKNIATKGDRSRRLPACSQCHNSQSAGNFPSIEGQYYAYLRNQLLLWKKGGRQSTPHGELMSIVADRMSYEQIDAVSAYYASLTSFRYLGSVRQKQAEKLASGDNP